MPGATESAIHSLLNETERFDLQKYAKCKKILNNKDRLLAQTISDLLLNEFNALHGTIRLLDIGTCEASLIQKILHNLSIYSGNSRQCVNLFPTLVDCVEPESTAKQHIKRVAKYIKSKNFILNHHKLSIQNFLGSKRCDLYNAILCIHVLYHIQMPEWISLFKMMIQSLMPCGAIILNLVSKKSDIFKPMQELEKQFKKHNVTRLFDSCGYMYFAEDVEQLLASVKCTVDSIDIQSTLSLEPTMSEGSIKQLHFVKYIPFVFFLAFMYRVTVPDLLKAGKEIVKEMLQLYAYEHQFETIDKMFILRGTRI